VRTDPAGRVTVFTRAPSQDQGHETVFAQICADQIGAPLDKITVLGGDTSLTPHGIGTFASRVGVLACNAVSESSIAVKKCILELAADRLQAASADLVVEDGKMSVVGAPGHAVSFAEIRQALDARQRPERVGARAEEIRYFKAPKISKRHAPGARPAQRRAVLLI
jgi:aerobic carbon-monoxide dehydrogenase large subunit